MSTLEPGESVQVKITKGLTYTVTNTGWALTIKSTQPLMVIPEDEQTVGIGCINCVIESEDDI